MIIVFFILSFIIVNAALVVAPVAVRRYHNGLNLSWQSHRAPESVSLPA